MDRDDAAVQGELELHRRQPLWIWVLFGIAVLTTMIGVPLALLAFTAPPCIHGEPAPRWDDALAALAPAGLLWAFVVLGVKRLSDRARVSWDAWGLYEWSVPRWTGGADDAASRSSVRTAIPWDRARAELELTRDGALAAAHVFDDAGRCISLLTPEAPLPDARPDRACIAADLAPLEPRLRALPLVPAAPLDVRDRLRPTALWTRPRVVFPLLALGSIACACVPPFWALFGLALSGAFVLTSVPATVELARLARVSWTLRGARRLVLQRREGEVLFAKDEYGREHRLDARGWSASDASLAVRPRGVVFARLGPTPPSRGPYREPSAAACAVETVETELDRRERHGRLVVVAVETVARLAMVGASVLVSVTLLWMIAQLT